MTTLPELWLVAVTLPNGATDTYMFDSKQNVLSSIYETWSKRDNDIAVKEASDLITVHERGVLVVTATLIGPHTIMHEATHF